MLYVDIPTLPELKALAVTRADPCVSIYLPTTPLTEDAQADRIAFKNLAKLALDEVRRADFDPKRVAALEEHLADLVDDEAFWQFQARSLAVLATPDATRSYRLPSALVATAQASDRFHLKPLLRAVSFPHTAFVLALSQNAVRLVEVFADLPPRVVKVDGLPKDAASAVGRASVRSRSPSGRILGSEGHKVLLRQYARSVDSALRGLLAGRETPLILAATEPIASIYRSVSTYPSLTDVGLGGAPDRASDQELAERARAVLDGVYAEEIGKFASLFETRAGQSRTTTDLSDAARAATFGAIEALLVDMDEVVPGTVDEVDGRIALAATSGADSYGVVDEIACRSLITGARVLSVRKQDIPHRASLAAILRRPV